MKNLLESKLGVMLDIGCGANKQPGFVGIDIQDLPEVDIVWDVLRFPWPLDDESVINAFSSHLVEHIPPFLPDTKLLSLINLLLKKQLITEDEVAEHVGNITPVPSFIGFMNEVWRVLKPESRFAISCPHGRSNGFLQDPTHINEINEVTWAYFDPENPQVGNLLWNFYKPKPWKLVFLNWNPDANIEVILEKRMYNE